MKRIAEKRITRLFVAVLSVMMVATSMPMLAYADTSSKPVVKYVYDSQNPAKKTGIESVTMDGIQYYDINKGVSDNNAPTKGNQIAFYKAALAATPVGSDKSILNQWAEIAEALIEGNTDYSFMGDINKYSDTFNTSIAAALSNVNESYRLEHSYTEGNIGSSGLRYANNLNDVRKDSAKELRKVINRSADVDRWCEAWAEDNKDYFLDNEDNNGTCHSVLNNTKQRDVIYTIATSYNNSYAYDDYNSIVVAFYDFKLAPLAGDGLEYITAAEGYESVQSAKESNVPGVSYSTNARDNQQVSYYKNNSKVDNAISASFNETSTESISNSTSSSESYSYSDTIGGETSIGTTFKFGDINETAISQKASYSTTTGETLSTAWSDTKSLSKTTSNTITSSLTLPAHTAAEILSYSGETNMSLDYDCPVALEYKVAISSLSGEVDQPMLLPYKKSFSTVFGIASDGSLNAALGGETAIENLYNRAIKNANDTGFEKSYGQASMWSNHLDEKGDNAKFNNIVKNDNNAKSSTEWLTSHVPMSAAGSTLSYTFKSQGQETGDVVPIYPIHAIYTANARRFGDIAFSEGNGITTIADYINAADLAEGIDVESGGKFYTNQIVTRAFNRYEIPFYGYDYTLGKWERVVKNAEGKWVRDTNEYNDNIAKYIISDSGAKYIQFGDIKNIDPTQTELRPNEDGEYEVYFQFFFDESRYTSLEGSDQNTNEKVYREIVKLNIGENRFDGTVKLEGDYTGYADGVPVNLNEELNAYALDGNGKEFNVSITWACKSKSGIQLTTDGDLTLTKAGTYQVKAKSGESESDWLTITAKAARVVSSMEFNLPEFTTAETKLTKENNAISYDFASFLQFKDQYGDKWTGSRPENLGFKLDDDYEGASLNNGILTVTEPGTYKVFAINGNDRDSATIEIKDGRKYTAAVSTDELSGASAELNSNEVSRNGKLELTITPNDYSTFVNAPTVTLAGGGTAVLGKLVQQDDGSYKCSISGVQSDITVKVTGKTVVENEWKVNSISVPKSISVRYSKQPVNLYDTIKVAIENKNGKHLNREYTWDAKELGVSIDDKGVANFGNEGTYHVQAVCEGVRSDWIEVKVIDRDKLDRIEFKAPELENSLITFTDGNDELKLELNGGALNFLSYFNQYDEAWTGAVPAISFSLDEGVSGAEINGNTLTVGEPGTYTIHAKADGFDIEPIRLSFADKRTLDVSIDSSDLGGAFALVVEESVKNSNKVVTGESFNLIFTPEPGKEIVTPPTVNISQGSATIGEPKKNGDGTWSLEISDIKAAIVLDISGGSEEYAYTMNLNGGYTMVVGDSAYNLNNMLTLDIRNSSGEKISKKYAWEVQEGSGLTVDAAGNVSANAPGTYHVRAIAGEGEHIMTSNYVTISVIAINPPAVKISKLTKGKKCFTAKWKKQTANVTILNKRVDGYAIRYSSSPSMADSNIAHVGGYKKTSKKVKGLVKKQKYYVQLATYSTYNGRIYYSSWSGVKSVKIK